MSRSATVPTWRPASAEEQSLWLLEQCVPGTGANNIAFAITLDGAVQPSALADAIIHVVNQHRALHTRFRASSAGLTASTALAEPAELTLESVPSAAGGVAGTFAEFVRRPFALEGGILVRAAHAQAADGDALAFAFHNHRAVVWGTGRDDLPEKLAAVSRGECGPGKMVGQASPRPALAFVFPGVGWPLAGTARDLRAAFPDFARAFDTATAALDACLADVAEHSVAGVVLAPAGSDLAALSRQDPYAQAGLFAAGLGLFRLIESWGIRPDFMTGRSVGELAAAHAAGVLSLQDACALVAARAQRGRTPGGPEVRSPAVSGRPPAIPLVSGTTGTIVTTEQAADPAYWTGLAADDAGFPAAVRTLAAEGWRS